MLVLAIMWNLVAGYADIATVGQHGVRRRRLPRLLRDLRRSPISISFSGDPGLASLVALAIKGFAMFVVFRLRTAYLSIATWVIAEVLMLIAGKIAAFGGGSRLQPAGRDHARPSERRERGANSRRRLLAAFALAFPPSAKFAATCFLLRLPASGSISTAMRGQRGERRRGSGSMSPVRASSVSSARRRFLGGSIAL